MLIDVICLQLAFVISYMIRNGLNNPYGLASYKVAAIFICLIDLCVGFFMESYKGILRRGYWQEFKATFVHTCIVAVGVLVLLFVLKDSASVSRTTMLVFPFIAITFVYAGRLILKEQLKRHAGPAVGKRSIMLLGNEENYQTLVDDFLNNPYSEFKVACAALIETTADVPEIYRDTQIVVGEETVLSYILSNWVDEILISLPRECEVPENIIDKCTLMGVTVHFQLAKLTSQMPCQFVEKIEGYTVLSNSVSIATPRQLFVKRSLDIAGSIVGCLLTGVILLFVGPMIYAKSPGPVFFKQERVGKNGRKFQLYKFRSMYMDAEERKKELMEQNNIRDGMMFKMDDDPRIIKGIGNFIRDYSLDEFPQFWNVLKGDMSLVGTRPPTVDEWEKYEHNHRGRLAIKPGITGMWQVNGRSEITDFDEVVRLDKEYILNWNIGLDLKILLQTVAVVLGKKGAK